MLQGLALAKKHPLGGNHRGFGFVLTVSVRSYACPRASSNGLSFLSPCC